jgi:hypothetical protein
MKEAAEGSVWLEDVDVETFILFSQFVYTGAYGPVPTGDPHKGPKEHDTWFTPPPYARTLLDEFRETKIPVGRPWTFLPRWTDRSGRRIWLSHAKLYVFADKYCIHLLQRLVLEALHDQLCELDTDASNDEFIEILQYSYENTRDSTAEHSAETEEPLRMLVIRFAAAWVLELLEHTSFRKLLAEDAMMSRDLVYAMARKPVRPPPKKPRRC